MHPAMRPLAGKAALALGACAFVLLTTSAGHAQTPNWPDAAEIERARQTHPFPRPDQLHLQPAPAPPRIDLPHAPAPIDIEMLARSGAPLTRPAPATATSAVRIFITLAMPRASLQLLIDQAARSGAVLVLRGLKADSMRQTLTAVADLIGEHRVAWVIDPEAFTRYRIEHAPTFVLDIDPRASRSTCGTECRIPPGFVSVSGDVSLGHALDVMARHHPDAQLLVAPLLARLKAP